MSREPAVAVVRTRWVAGGLFLLSLLARIFDLDAAFNVDGVMWWSRRIDLFWEGIFLGEPRKTFQVHPGVTLMWLGGASRWFSGVLGQGYAPAAMVAAKWPVVAMGSLVAPGSYLLLRRLLKEHRESIALLAGFLMATEPLLVFHSRVAHIDMLFVGFAWLAVLALANVAESASAWKWALISGALFGLAGLTRTSGATVLAGALIGLCVWGHRRPWRNRAALGLVVACAAAFTVFALWPALNSEPVWAFTELVSKTETMVSHDQEIFLLGGVESVPGLRFYVVALVVRTSPLLVAGLLPACWFITRQRFSSPWLGLILSYAVFTGVVLLSSRTGTRYMLPLLPLLCALSAMGLITLAGVLRGAVAGVTPRRWRAIGLALMVLFAGARIGRIVSLHPFPSAWCPEYPGLQCEELIGMGWGEGMKEVALWVDAHRGQPRPLIFMRGYGIVMAPWLAYRPVRSPDRAEFIVRYLSEAQRNWDSEAVRPYIQRVPPAHVVRLNGIRFAQIYYGPRHPAFRRGRSD